MKKQKVLVILTMCIFSIFSISSTIYANGLDTIAPYKAVLDKLNKELGSSMSIPENDEAGFTKEQIYNSFNTYSPEEFENYMRKEYEAIKLKTNITFDSRNGNVYYDGVKSENNENFKMTSYFGGSEPLNSNEIKVSSYNESLDIEPYYTRQDLTQNIEWESGKVFLNSVVFSATGSNYIYERIINHGHYILSDRTHFRSRNSHNYLNSSKDVCTVVYNGSYFTKEGYNLATDVTFTIDYEL